MARLTDAGKELISDADTVLHDEISALSIPASESKAMTNALGALVDLRFS